MQVHTVPPKCQAKLFLIQIGKLFLIQWLSRNTATIQHGMFPSTEYQEPLMKKFEQELTRFRYTILSDRLMLKRVLDPSSLLRAPEEKQKGLECYTNLRMCFTLQKRCIVRGSPLLFVTAINSV